MGKLYEELKRRKVFRVAAVYAVVAWVLIQVSDIVLPTFGAPAWVIQTLIFLFLIGFPVALVLAWAFELTPDGIRPESLIQSSQPGDQSIDRKPLYAVISIFVFISVVVIWQWQFAASSGIPSMAGEEISQAAVSPALQESRESNPVLAVLPFTNMSSIAENEYLADGITEDIITLLAQSPGMEVIARNSTFKYKNQNPDVRNVGRDLGADYVVEGSIRPVGDNIRVTVQVIEADAGSHIWAEQYDRPLAEFFDVQDEVSLGVAAAVGDAVFREGNKEASQSRTENMTAWELTSRAIGNPGSASVTLARQALSLDPNYALAHAILARSLANQVLANIQDQELATEAETEARLALQLAPNDPRVLIYAAVGLLWAGHPEEALSIAERVPKISPSYAEGLVWYGDILIHNGRSLEAVPYIEKGIRLTPNAPQLSLYLVLLGEGLMHHGNFVDAEDPLARAVQFRQAPGAGADAIQRRYLAGAQMRLGKNEEAKENLHVANGLTDSSIADEKSTMEFYSTDGGGEYFKAVWADLQRLSAIAIPND